MDILKDPQANSQQIQLPSQSSQIKSSSFMQKLYYILGFILIFFLGNAVGYYLGLTKGREIAVKAHSTHVTMSPITPSFITQTPTALPTISPTSGRSLIIKNSGSTNSPAATLIVNVDGSGNVTYTGQGYQLQHVSSPTKNFPKGTFITLLSIADQIANVSQIPTQQCTKSISFGSTTKILYNGYASGDLQCIAADASQVDKDLANEVQKALNVAQNF